MNNFIVVGATRGLSIQAMISIHAFAPANCVAAHPEGMRFLRFSNLCAEHFVVDLDGEGDNAFVEKVNALAETMPDLIVIPSDCKGARVIDRVRDRLNARIFPSPNRAMLDCFDNKWRFYEFCRERGLTVPVSAFVASKNEIDFASLSRSLGTPFIIKPLDQGASHGVHVISSMEDYKRKLLDDDNYRYAPLIAQKYIYGTDVGLDLLAIGGRVTAMAMQERAFPQHDGARIRFFYNSYLEEVAHSIAESGYHGLMNVDARIEDESGKVFLLESNPRFWRSFSAATWCGLNFVEEGVKALQGRPELHTLTSGNADVFYHPIFRPRLWPYAVRDWHSHQGHMVRFMICDICTLMVQSRSVWNDKKQHMHALRTSLPLKHPGLFSRQGRY